MTGQDHIRRITQVLTGGAVVAVNDVDAAPSASEAQFWRSLEELLPVFEREGIRLVLEPHPDDFVEDGQAGVPWRATAGDARPPGTARP